MQRTKKEEKRQAKNKERGRPWKKKEEEKTKKGEGK